MFFFFFFKQKTAYEMRISDWSSDVCSSDLHAGSGDEGKLYTLIFRRAMASQMASAQLERTTVTLREATGRHELRATGQVVKFPGFLAVYEEGRDIKADDDESEALLPVMHRGDCPLKRAVDADQHFTPPPPDRKSTRLNSSH